MANLTSRDRFVRTLLGQDVDRPPHWVFWGPWATAWARWKREGMTHKDFSELHQAFGCDRLPHRVAVNCGPCPAIPRKTIEETDEYVIFTDSWGIRRKNLKANESMSQFLEFPVKNWDDWRAFKKLHLDPHHPQRLAGNWRKNAAAAAATGCPLKLGYYPDVGVFGSLRWLLGDEECLLAFYTDPELVADIMNSVTDVYVTVFDAVAAEIAIDEIHIWEDMSGRQGSLISPDHWRQFMLPCYRRIHEVAKRHNIPLMSVDTDGQPDLIVPPMMEGGVNLLFPLEVAAGCDINVYRAKYPTLGCLGGFDKRAMAQGPDAIDAELQRIAPAVRAGRYIPCPDHLIPDDVSWANFQYFAQALGRLVRD